MFKILGFLEGLSLLEVPRSYVRVLRCAIVLFDAIYPVRRDDRFARLDNLSISALAALAALAVVVLRDASAEEDGQQKG